MENQSIITGTFPFILGQRWSLRATNVRYLSTLFECEYGAFERETFKETLKYMQLRHDILRIRLVEGHDGWQQFIPPPDESVPLTQVVLANQSEQDDCAIRETIRSVYQELDRGEGPLVRVIYFERRENKPDLLLVILPHLISDLYSHSLFFTDCFKIYMSIQAGKEIQQGPKPPSFKQFAEEIRAYTETHLSQEFKDYWSVVPWKKARPLPADYSDEHILQTKESWHNITIDWDIAETAELLNALSLAHLPVLDVLLTALALTSSQWTGQPFSHIMSMDTGRMIFSAMLNMDLTHTIGFLAVNRRLFLDVGNIRSPREAVREVQKQLHAIPHRGVGCDVISSCCNNQDVTDSIDLHILEREQIMLNYQGKREEKPFKAFPLKASREYQDIIDTWESPPLIEKPRTTTPPRTYRALYYHVVIANGQLRFKLGYDQSIYKQATVEHFYQDFKKNLKSTVV